MDDLLFLSYKIKKDRLQLAERGNRGLIVRWSCLAGEVAIFPKAVRQGDGKGYFLDRRGLLSHAALDEKKGIL